MRNLLLLAFVFLGWTAWAERLSSLATSPDWSELERFQETITRGEFIRQLETIYAPHDAARGLVEVGENAAEIVERTGETNRFTLRFAKDAAAKKPVPKFWRTRRELGPPPSGKPLRGMRIALDPGHLGGGWARMEERWFRIGQGVPVTEGDLALRVAELLAPKLTELGAEVLWARRSPMPTTEKRPSDFFPIARELLAAQGNPDPPFVYTDFADPRRGETVQSQAELLFYRQAEIRERARQVNANLKPDLVLCLHFNAEAWGHPTAPDFVPRNHFHILVNGCYSAGELRYDDNRYEMLWRLLEDAAGEEQRVATIMARHLARTLALPPYLYTRDVAMRINDNPYVWVRNLLANRLYRCPVIFLEPYVMNSQEVWERVQAGDYEGERLVAGSVRKSLVREYADSVAAALREAMR